MWRSALVTLGPEWMRPHWLVRSSHSSRLSRSAKVPAWDGGSAFPGNSGQGALRLISEVGHGTTVELWAPTCANASSWGNHFMTRL